MPTRVLPLFLGLGLSLSQASSTSAALSKVTKYTSIEVSSGGVSLGSYQGGYLYARTLANTDNSDFRILTGASAGAINMLGGLYYGYHDVRKHTWSPYRSWLEIGWKNLRQQGSKHGHLFDTAAIAFKLRPIVDSLLTQPDLDRPYPEAVWLGFAVTRFLPRRIGSSGIRTEKMDEKIVIGMQWLGPASVACPESLKPVGCWRAWTEIDSSLHRRRMQPFLYFGLNGTDTSLIRRNLIDLALASSAFPVAFPRHPIRMGLLDTVAVDKYPEIGRPWKSDMARPSEPGPACSAPDTYCLPIVESGDPDYGKWVATRYPTFSDGGLFENEPLNLARKIREFLSRKYHDGLDSISAVRFCSPMNYAPIISDTQQVKVWQSDIPEWIALFSRRGKTKSTLEVTHFMDESRIPDRLLEVSTTHLPLAAEHIGHFSAFFDREFRNYDFAAGMFDGFRQYLPGEDTAALARALELLNQDGQDTLRAQLAFLWPIAAKIYACDKDPDSGRCLEDKAKRQEKALARVKDILPSIRHQAPKQNGLKDFARVMKGSLRRMRGTLEAHRESEDETDKDRFGNFAKGYKKFGTPLLGKTVSDDLYEGVRDMIGNDEMSLENSLFYPLALYHARQGLGYFLGAYPSFHTPYLKIDGSADGFRFLQGIPFRNPERFWKIVPTLNVEVGIHTMAAEFAFRHDFLLFLESNFSIGWLSMGLNYGVGAETTFDLKPRGWIWPRMEMHFFDVLSLGADFKGHANFLDGKPGPPLIALGTRFGFNAFSVMRGTLAGTKKHRRVP